ncbi:bifunctional 5,10-methylenetetrahydrofolate dehydrogenase/5,10-methenyltetrahydrofolate cyclohydrolase [Rickettsiales endosymbiont of Trichoplax sp. H2]|uniref:bifunctional 5,10-methylenetetrahydrofolate dehydrogenase/5,10-methenyltetrahydrofolate cyclohydrolase n=1 Tax=Rickettsiales endosymbiont of Trichoplax sp. H2 TaxID=2021221 RepID=UPI0012B295BA|nr:bifunctional 5,10-methylenetetrahydrofolate dehydrogenase/5,10-methenyltetrahydrofolate cyclohydrolase [Rickettsiales endosymbiont of Trichoplax sp. H2]MSO13749.1 Bifunctional protein FolD [Rickettsiales endosymbiont of Trichoplax sp. H2]
MTNIIDGKLLAENILKLVKNKVNEKFNQTNLIPKIATVLVGDNPASEIYVKAKLKAAKKVGINTKLINIYKEITNDELHNLIISLNNDISITGILVQLPLCNNLNEYIVFKSIDYKKDVDGFGILNTGLLNHWKSEIIPCTPQGILYILKKYIKDLSGKKAVIIGRSIIVGRPMSSILIKENCTVTVTHSKTKNIKNECKNADILISAAGVPNLVKESWVKDNAFVVDVGINRVNNKLIGDVDFDNVKNKASFITPVPGGIGPLTVANLMLNTLRLFYIQNNLVRDEIFF